MSIHLPPIQCGLVLLDTVVYECLYLVCEHSYRASIHWVSTSTTMSCKPFFLELPSLRSHSRPFPASGCRQHMGSRLGLLYPVGCPCPPCHRFGLPYNSAILLKAALNGRSSKLMPDKGSFWMFRELRELKLQLPATLVKLAAAVSGGSPMPSMVS